LPAHKIGRGRVGRSACAGEVRGPHARPIAVIGKRPAFDDRPRAVGACPARGGVAFGDGGGAVLRVVGVGVDRSVFDAAGHVAIRVVRVRVRCSRFGADTGHGVRDGRAVGEGPREPACWIRGLRVVHAGVR